MNNPFNKPSCGFACPEEHRCLAHGHDIPETATFYTCEICGNQIVNYIYDSGKIICGNCYEKLNTCLGCRHGQHCQFEENPSPIPKVVMQTIRQGNSIMQMQVKNPERIKICCEGCACFEKEGCKRLFSICGEYNFIYSNEDICHDKNFEAGQ